MRNFEVWVLMLSTIIDLRELINIIIVIIIIIIIIISFMGRVAQSV